MMCMGYKFLRDQRGGLVVEAALILPLLIGAGLGVLDASYMMVQNHKLESQLSVAANYLSKSDSPELREATAKNLAVMGSITGGSESLVKDWSTEDISVTYLATENPDGLYRGDETIRTVQLTTQLDYSGLGILSSILPQKPVLTARVQERVVGGGL